MTEPEPARTTPLCKCGKHPAEEPHTCPYADEINDDSETLCRCCAECTQECAWDI
jgi:hypothetical protein